MCQQGCCAWRVYLDVGIQGGGPVCRGGRLEPLLLVFLPGGDIAGVGIGQARHHHVHVPPAAPYLLMPHPGVTSQAF